MTRARDLADSQDNLGGAVAPFVAGKNAVINGGFDIWQRGTSFTINSASVIYTADRFGIANASSQVWQRYQDAPSNSGLIYSIGNNGAVATWLINHLVELPVAGVVDPYTGVWTISFYGKFDNGRNINVTGQFSGGGGAQSADFFAGTAVGTGAWKRYTFTATLGAIGSSGNNAFRIWIGDLSGISSTIVRVTGLQFEAGLSATPFSRAGGSIGGELSLCQRYYWRSAGNGTYNYGIFAIGSALSTTGAMMQMKLPVTMRTRPTAIEYGGALQLFDGVTAIAITSMAINTDLVTTVDLSNFRATVASGLTQYRLYQLSAGADSTSYVGYSAEL